MERDVEVLAQFEDGLVLLDIGYCCVQSFATAARTLPVDDAFKELLVGVVADELHGLLRLPQPQSGGHCLRALVIVSAILGVGLLTCCVS